MLWGDRAGFDAWHDLQCRFATNADDDATQEWARCFSFWTRIADGNVDDLDAECQSLRTAATHLKEPGLLIVATSQSALIAVANGALEEGIKLARRASRMGRAEALPQFEYLANWVLARLRRTTGYPHLATRILQVLLDVAQPNWHPLLSWELLMSGEYSAASERFRAASGPAAGSPLGLATTIVDDAIRHASQGARPEFGAQRGRMINTTWFFAMHQAEATALLAALDPNLPVSDVPEGMRSWRRAGTHEAPASLAGFVPPADKAPDWGAAGAFVLVEPHGSLRRIVLNGVGLVEKGALRITSSNRGKGRLETAACLLAERMQEGWDTDEFFREVYGLEMDPALHEAAFVSLLHRVRVALQGAGTVITEGGRCRLSLDRAVIIPDTRCRQSPEDRILRVLAQLGTVSAEEAARIAGIPLRTIQAALRTLTSDGACTAVREGRKVRYVVEDTTFHPPTLAT